MVRLAKVNSQLLGLQLLFQILLYIYLISHKTLCARSWRLWMCSMLNFMENIPSRVMRIDKGCSQGSLLPPLVNWLYFFLGSFLRLSKILWLHLIFQRFKGITRRALLQSVQCCYINQRSLPRTILIIGHVRYIRQYSNMDPRLLGQNYRVFKVPFVSQFPKQTWIHRKHH